MTGQRTRTRLKKRKIPAHSSASALAATRSGGVPEALSKISKAIANLVQQIATENQSGLYSMNVLVEDLLLPVFQIIFDAPNLRNLNRNKVGSPIIDLADDSKKLAIQVTTERSAGKITETLTAFIAARQHKKYKRLIFAILSPGKLSYRTESKRKWLGICKRKFHFNSDSDIVSTLALFPLIRSLPAPKIYEVESIIATSLIGERYVDIEATLAKQALRQLEYEKHSRKYIPDIFVETRATKQLARHFSHPALFFPRALESLGRLNVPGWNEFLHKAGLPPLQFPNLGPHAEKKSIEDIYSATTQLLSDFVKLTDQLEVFHTFTHKKPSPIAVKKSRRHFYEQNIHVLQNDLGWGFAYYLKDFLAELSVGSARVFILSGRAGQGKTNLVVTSHELGPPMIPRRWTPCMIA